MARVTQVQHARKENRCGKCGTPILVGDPYRHASPRAHLATAGIKMVRCIKATCAFKTSDLTTSKMSGVYATQEDLQLAIDGDFTPADVLNSLQEAAEAVRAVGKEYREGATNIEDGFGHETMQSQEMTEKADALDEYADALENVSLDDADEFDELESETQGLEDEDRLGEIEDRQQEIRENVASTVEDAINELSI
ncbi:hypothetical protein LCGC14_3086400 [marine sediment metagenome]|uniref:Uncharacterized protein n=1 Tax=marine sediment metagenome TaxID=412755 RepID=A0A0F8WBM9_9ZZZZ